MLKMLFFHEDNAKTKEMKIKIWRYNELMLRSTGIILSLTQQRRRQVISRRRDTPSTPMRKLRETFRLRFFSLSIPFPYCLNIFSAQEMSKHKPNSIHYKHIRVGFLSFVFISPSNYVLVQRGEKLRIMNLSGSSLQLQHQQQKQQQAE